MTFACSLTEHELKRRIKTFGRGVVDPHLPRQAIRDAEADADDIVSQSVGVGLHQRRRVCSIALDDPCRESGAESVRSQEHQYVLQVFLRLHRLRQLGNLLLTKAAELLQALRFLFDDAQGVVAKLLDDLLCGRRADAFDQPGRQVGLDASCRRRCDGFERFYFQLGAELGVRIFLPSDPQALPFLQSSHRTYGCNYLASSSFYEFQHRPSGVRIAEREPVDHAFDGHWVAATFVAHRNLGAAPHCHAAAIR